MRQFLIWCSRACGIALGLLICSTVWADLPEFKPGAETRVKDPGYRGYYLVHVPKHYTAERPWPVILTYHGYNGKPNTGPFKKILGGKHFIIVGMDHGSQTYHEKPALALDGRPALLKTEKAKVHRVLDTLETQLHIDRKRVVMGGFSQGGYQTSVLGEAMLAELNGLAILGAGRTFTEGHHPPDARLIRGKPVFLGAGANDDRHRKNAEKSLSHYRRWGAAVELEIWPGIGHQAKTDSQKLRYWLLSRGPLDGAERRIKMLKKQARTDAPGAVRELEAIAAVETSHPSCKRARIEADRLTESFRARLAEADVALEAGEIDQAVEALVTVARAMPETSLASAVEKRLATLRENPETKPLVEQALIDLQADAIEARARRAEAKGDENAALALYEQYLKEQSLASRFAEVQAHYEAYATEVVERKSAKLIARADAAEKRKDYNAVIKLLTRHIELYPRAKNHAAVAKRLEALRNDPQVAQAQRSAEVEKQCKPKLAMARSCITAGMPDKAAPLLKEVAAKYPDTDWAAQAGEMLDALDKQ